MNAIIDRWLERVCEDPIVVVDLDTAAISKERPRVGKSGHVYTPKRTKDFERKIASHALNAVESPVTYPIKVSVTIWETPPKTWPPEKRLLALHGLIVPTRGDLDNQVKAITDGLNGVAYVDDVQINRIDANRVYGIRNRILVTITQSALSPVQIDHAVASLKANTNGQGNADRGGSKLGQ